LLLHVKNIFILCFEIFTSHLPPVWFLHDAGLKGKSVKIWRYPRSCKIPQP